MSELEGDPGELLLFIDGETEAQGRTCLATSPMKAEQEQASWLTVWPLGWVMLPAAPQLRQSIWDRRPCQA